MQGNENSQIFFCTTSIPNKLFWIHSFMISYILNHKTYMPTCIIIRHKTLLFSFSVSIKLASYNNNELRLVWQYWCHGKTSMPLKKFLLCQESSLANWNSISQSQVQRGCNCAYLLQSYNGYTYITILFSSYGYHCLKQLL